MTVGSDTFWPHCWLVRPHGHVIVQIVGEMIGDQILAGDPQIHRVPKLKLSSHPVQLIS